MNKENYIDNRVQYKEKTNSENIRIYIEEDAFEQFKMLVQNNGISHSSYLRMRVFSSISHEYVAVHKPMYIYTGKNINKLSFTIPKEVREHFQELCGRFGVTQSDVIRGWVYQCLDMQKLFPKDL